MKKLYFFSFFTLLMSGCSTYTKKECENFDHRQLGYFAGVSGEHSHNSALEKFKNTCGKDHGLLPDEAKMKEGWSQGLQLYCSEEGGARAGSAGQTYTGACPKESESKFWKTYNPSRMAFLEKKVVELEARLRAAESDQSSFESKLRSCESELSTVRSQLSLQM